MHSGAIFLSCLVSCHIPGENVISIPPLCLCIGHCLTLNISHTPTLKSYTSFQTKLNYPPVKPPLTPQFTFPHLPVGLWVCLCCHIHNSLLERTGFHSFNKYLSSVHCVPGAILRATDTVTNQAKQSLSFQGGYIPSRHIFTGLGPCLQCS